MREIKFRGKNKDIGWVYGQLAYDINGNVYIIQEVELDSSYGIEETILFATMWYRVEKETIGQYTGLKDKNGKEIYEGDIILIDAYTYEGPEFDGEYLVTYNELLGMWNLVNLEKYSEEKEDFITFENLNGWYKLDIKLLGNIYENKELLNETNR